MSPKIQNKNVGKPTFLWLFPVLVENLIYLCYNLYRNNLIRFRKVNYNAEVY